jgi:hypothetical protein
VKCGRVVRCTRQPANRSLHRCRGPAASWLVVFLGVVAASNIACSGAHDGVESEAVRSTCAFRAQVGSVDLNSVLRSLPNGTLELDSSLTVRRPPTLEVKYDFTQVLEPDSREAIAFMNQGRHLYTLALGDDLAWQDLLRSGRPRPGDILLTRVDGAAEEL